jgi:RsiW-degrading membrane proteinase PrsW (M82 family)
MSAESTEDKFATLPVSNIYTEICTGIRETDDASFRLLSLVPLVSGTALIAVIFQQSLRPEVELLLSLFAAGITFGLFRWELRNIQTCSWLLRFAEAIESDALQSHPKAENFCKRPDAPYRIGKTKAEKLIYTVTILAWLALPLAVGAVPHLPFGAAVTYCTVAGIILCLTAISLSENVRVQGFLAKEATAQSVKPGNS